MVILLNICMMKNCYELSKLPSILNTGLPLIDDHGLVPVDYSKTFYNRFETPSVFRQELFDWLDSLNLYYLTAGYAYVPANGSILPHVDSRLYFRHQKFVDFCKINWRIGGPGSVVKWYDTLPGFELITQPQLPDTVTTNGEAYPNVCLPADINKFQVSFSIEHPEICLLNPGRLHSFDAGPYAQHIISVAVGIKNTNSVLPWNQGIKIFKKYIVH